MIANCPLFAFLCLAAAMLSTGSMASHGQVCPESWTFFGPRCFKFFHSKKSWTEAEKSCKSQNANLASIHSEAENAFIVRLIQKATKKDQRTWLGGFDAVKEGEWMWIDGSSWDYNKWYSGEPNNVGKKEHNLMINHQAKHWNDSPASSSFSYICAKPSPQKSLSLTLDHNEYTCTP